MAKGGKREGAGRPKGIPTLESERARVLLVERLRVHWGPIVDVAIQQALSGDKSARDWLSDRGFGKVKEQVEMTGKDGEALIPKDAVAAAIAKEYEEKLKKGL